MPQYRLAASAEAERLETSAAAASERAKDANQRANNDMLGVVLFAMALFFAGLSAKLEAIRIRGALLGLGCLVFVAALTWIAALPVRLTT
jgi:hypothetical protein